jgi:hypothetical protein
MSIPSGMPSPFPVWGISALGAVPTFAQGAAKHVAEWQAEHPSVQM